MTSPFDEKDHAINEGREPEQPPLLPKWFSKVVIALGGILMLLLMLSYLLPYNFPWLISGQVTSAVIDHNVLNLESGQQIIFDDALFEELQTLYYAQQHHEFVVCLLGTRKGDQYYLQSISTPKIYGQGFDYVRSEPCPDETLVFLHTHPYKSCFLSQQDVNTFEVVLGRNPDTLMAVMCEEDRFMVMNREQLLDNIADQVDRSGNENQVIFGGSARKT